MKKHKLFVYGTLRSGMDATHQLDGYAMFAVSGMKFDFPFIQNMGDRMLESISVVGNIKEVTDKELERLDTYEGIARGLYSRIQVEVEDITDTDTYGSIEEVWVYVGGPALINPTIESGDWLKRGV